MPDRPSATAQVRARTRPAPSNASSLAGANFFPGIPRENILSITDRRLDEVENRAGEPTLAPPKHASQVAQAPEVQSTPESQQNAKTPVVLAAPVTSEPQEEGKTSGVVSTPTTPEPSVKQTGGWVARSSKVVRP